MILGCAISSVARAKHGCTGGWLILWFGENWPHYNSTTVYLAVAPSMRNRYSSGSGRSKSPLGLHSQPPPAKYSLSTEWIRYDITLYRWIRDRFTTVGLLPTWLYTNDRISTVWLLRIWLCTNDRISTVWLHWNWLYIVSVYTSSKIQGWPSFLGWQRDFLFLLAWYTFFAEP